MEIADLRFLIVDDQSVQRRILLEMLTHLGAKSILQAEDGLSAFNIIEAQDWLIDIVITDLRMPEMDGMEFIRRLGSAEFPVSIIIISALDRSLIASVEAMAAAYDISILGALSKPITAEKLMALVSLHEREAARKKPSNRVHQEFTLDEITAGLKNDEFEPFFQPKVDLATQEVIGAEALARWRDSRNQIIPPLAFIAQLESSGLIDSLTRIILRKAAACCRTWRAAGMNHSVSVNLSIKSLADLQLATRVTELVREQNVDPGHVVLEVTESAVTTEAGKTLENLSRLRMNGFGLSIDDYGTGYSSMQQLARIAFTELKIDQFFVRDAAKQESSRIILESSLGMAKKLGIAVVGEGVETRSEWDLLLSLGCDIAQGYFIARPMEADVYLDWVHNWASMH